MKKQILSILMTAAMLLTLLPTAALAAEDNFSVVIGGTQVTGTENKTDATIEYVIDSADAEVTVTGNTTNGRIIVNQNAEITLDNVTMNLEKCKGSPIEIAENVSVTLILKGTNAVSAYADGPGILVSQGATLTIQRKGSGAGKEALYPGAA